MKKNKIAIFIPTLEFGGAEKVVLNLCRAFADENLDIDLVLWHARGIFLNFLPKTIRVIELNVDNPLSSIPKLVSYLNREKPYVLFSALPHCNIPAILAKMIGRINTKIIASEHNLLTKTPYSKKIFLLMKLLYRFSDKIICVSEDVQNEVISLLHVNRKQTSVIYNPIITPEIDHLVYEKVEHPWFLKKDRPIILSVGRLCPQKDFETLILAFSDVVKQIPSRLVILGSGEMKSCLLSLINKLNLTEHATIIDFDPNPYKYMAKSDTFVLSSIYEGFGNVLVEAMYCGCKIVSTANCNIPFVMLENGKLGQIVPIQNPQKLAEAIILELSIQRNKDILREKSLVCDYKNIAKQYLEVFYNS